MAQDENRLVWLDMEMSGLNPQVERILEVAILVTDSELNFIAEAPVIVVNQSASILANMDEWNRRTHEKSGLIERVKASLVTEAMAEDSLLAFLNQYLSAGSSPLCGNSVHQDRRFLERYMPKLEAWFHYRNLDISTLKELARRWHPNICKGFKKHGRHEALADIQESIDELRYYREHFLRLP